jgi:hypothetical protein
MRATIQKLNRMLRHCDAASEDYVLFIFRPPPFGLHVGDVIEFDAELLDQPQTATNITMGDTFSLELWQHNVHDLRANAEPGSSRVPLSEETIAA